MTAADMRVPPHSEDAERSVLGSLLLDAQGMVKISDFITESDFYRQPHRLIFRAFSELASRHQPADLITVVDELQRRGIQVQVANTGPAIELYSEIVGKDNRKIGAGFHLTC